MSNGGNNNGQGLVCIVELFGRDSNGRKMIAWGRRIGCRDAGHGLEPGRGVYTRLVVDDGDVQQHNFLMELIDNPAGLRAIDPARLGDLTTRRLRRETGQVGKSTRRQVLFATWRLDDSVTWQILAQTDCRNNPFVLCWNPKG